MKNKKKLLGLGLSLTILVLASCSQAGNTSTTLQSPTSTGAPSTTTSVPNTTTSIPTSAPTTNVEVHVPTTIYAAPGAKDGDGSKEHPYDFYMATYNALPGDTILLKEGVYDDYSYRIELHGSGAQGNYITIKPEVPGSRVVFDFHKMRFDGTNRGIQIYGDLWHIQDIEVCNAGDNGLYIAGSHNIIENCQFYNNKDTGLQLGRGYSNETHIDEWPSYNLIKNCTSFANYDDETLGENADGFAAKLTVGVGNVFDGCIAFRNSDDGWDLFAKSDSGNIGTVILYNCVSFENGYLPYQIDKQNSDGTTTRTYDTINGDGIGFKLGGSVMEGDVIVNNCAAFDNKLHGVGDNSNPGTLQVTNFTAFNNCSGLNADGTISTKRGIEDAVNKSNNIDLARSTNSYNSYYGILSYINNQSEFKATGDSNYNTDAYRGSTAYSIFQTEYDNGEIYRAFTGWEDASSYASLTVDSAYSRGEIYEGLTDDSFVDLKSINAICDSKDKLIDLLSIHTKYRNSDNSVNLGNLLKLKDEKLLTYCDGNPIGAVLDRTSYDSYPHYTMNMYEDESYQSMSDDEILVSSTKDVLEVITREEATFQTFDLPKLINGCEITWTSSNNDVIEISKNEDVSLSISVFSQAIVHTQDTDTKVTLTATISHNDVVDTKTFEINVLSRKQDVGSLTTIKNNSLRIDLYGKYVAPNIYPIDASSITPTELPNSKYDLVYTYQYAPDGNSKFNYIDGVYTSVAGVYRVTVTANSKISSNTASYTYNVYVVDPDCNIDFIDNISSVYLTKDGFNISGRLSNIEGGIYTIVSETSIDDITPEQVVNNENAQYYHITEDNIIAPFNANNDTLVDSSVQYYVYYVVANAKKNLSKLSSVYSFSTTLKEVSTKEDFYSLATTGKIGAEKAKTPTIYYLSQDLDFEGFNWPILNKANVDSFNQLFNGNNHTISNVTIEGAADGEKTLTLNLFYKISYGTLMNFKFDNISITSTDNESTNYGKQVGVVGDLQNGYLHNIRITRFKGSAKESVGALVGQVTGGKNYISNCSLVNPIPEDVNNNPYTISCTNKYAAGLVGNAQMNSDQSLLELTMTNCYVNAVIGDGKDVAGNFGGILGRAKNDSVNYLIDISKCVFIGTVIAKGQYNAGIVGDFDNGAGLIRINNCLSDVVFIYNGLVLDAETAFEENTSQYYAHKNSNPIIGRAVKGETGIYQCGSNIGSWSEYYADSVYSISLVFDMRDDETNEQEILSKSYVSGILKLDIENVWVFNQVLDEAKNPVGYELYLK